MSSEERGRRGTGKAGGPGSQQLSRPQGRNGGMRGLSGKGWI